MKASNMTDREVYRLTGGLPPERIETLLDLVDALAALGDPPDAPDREDEDFEHKYLNFKFWYSVWIGDFYSVIGE